MPSFDVDPERITVFRTADGCVLSHSFERDDRFAALREYDDEEASRFELPAEAGPEPLEETDFVIGI